MTNLTPEQKAELSKHHEDAIVRLTHASHYAHSANRMAGIMDTVAHKPHLLHRIVDHATDRNARALILGGIENNKIDDSVKKRLISHPAFEKEGEDIHYWSGSKDVADHLIKEHGGNLHIMKRAIYTMRQPEAVESLYHFAMSQSHSGLHDAAFETGSARTTNHAIHEDILNRNTQSGDLYNVAFLLRHSPHHDIQKKSFDHLEKNYPVLTNNLSENINRSEEMEHHAVDYWSNRHKQLHVPFSESPHHLALHTFLSNTKHPSTVKRIFEKNPIDSNTVHSTFHYEPKENQLAAMDGIIQNHTNYADDVKKYIGISRHREVLKKAIDNRHVLGPSTMYSISQSEHKDLANIADNHYRDMLAAELRTHK